LPPESLAYPALSHPDHLTLQVISILVLKKVLEKLICLIRRNNCMSRRWVMMVVMVVVMMVMMMMVMVQ
jgi:hypothetical protein